MAQQDSPVLSPHLHAFPTSCLLLGTHRYSSSFSVLWQGGVNGGRLVVYLQRPAWGGPHHTSLSGPGRKSSRTQHMLHVLGPTRLTTQEPNQSGVSHPSTTKVFSLMLAET